MKKRWLLVGLCVACFITTWLYLHRDPVTASMSNLLDEDEEEEEGSPERRALFVEERLKYEYDMVRDPVTGTVPHDIRNRELAIARAIPEKTNIGNPLARTAAGTYTPAGPTNIGGRTRAVAFDRRYNNSTNKVIIAGSVSGGIFRSADGGSTWARVSPDNDIHNLTVLAQDPRPGQEDTWYAGGGEPISNSASSNTAAYLNFGVWKSVNNGVSWTKLTREFDGSATAGGALEIFDNPFDIIHKITINPVNGDVYVAGHRRLLRSTNGGGSWSTVFSGTAATTSDKGQMDIVCDNTGKLYLGVNGGFPDANKRGIFTSADGINWTRIAGGATPGVDSVTGWRGNSYDANGRRILLAMAPSNQKIIYITYENGDKQSTGKPEADLFKLDVSSGSNVWTNLSANVPDFPGQLDGVDPFAIQNGYDLLVAVKPDDPNTVFLGGVNLFRSTNGFSSTSATSWIGGYGNTVPSVSIYGSNSSPLDMTRWSHPDMHALAFDPSNPARAICGNDGGIQLTNDIMANNPGVEPVTWTVISNYQTLQYYHVSIDPDAGRNNFCGGAQDNGTRFYDGVNLIGANPNPSNQFRLLGGDGGATGIAKAIGNAQTVYGTTQYGDIRRIRLTTGGPSAITSIMPNGLTPSASSPQLFGDFVSYFLLDFDNTENLYYVNFNRLFRTRAASTVSPSTWEELKGVDSAVNPTAPLTGTNISIHTMATSRGDYAASHALYIGTTNGHVFRFDNPRDNTISARPVDITPPQLLNTGYISNIAVNPNNDEEIMVVASNYTFNNNPIVNIWWTNNAKSPSPNWFNAEGTNLTAPSVRSCAIVVKKDASNNSVTEYYVGTSVGLYSALNIGNNLQGSTPLTWVREGGSTLNFAVINSLGYRPQDNTLLVGTHGNGMYFANAGTPDFRPNQNTGVNDPVRNDPAFIKQLFPSVADNQLTYTVGDMFAVKNIVVRVYTATGQMVFTRTSAYASGQVNVQGFASGVYIIAITSQDHKQQFIRKFIKP